MRDREAALKVGCGVDEATPMERVPCGNNLKAPAPATSSPP